MMNLAPNIHNHSNIVYSSGHKNPFDREFALALKQNQTKLIDNQLISKSITSTTSSSSTVTTNGQYNHQSPLNTPLIQPDTAFNPTIIPDISNDLVTVGIGTSIVDSSTTITTAQITTLILESEIVSEESMIQNHDNDINHISDTNNNLIPANNECDDAKNLEIISEKHQPLQPTLRNDNIDDNNNNYTQINQEINTVTTNSDDSYNDTNNNQNSKQNQPINPIKRSNLVSVICPPPSFKDLNDTKIRSAPVILESANNNNNNSNDNLSNDNDDQIQLTNLLNKKRKRLITEIGGDCNNSANNEYSAIKLTSTPSSAAAATAANIIPQINGLTTLPTNLPIAPNSLSSSNSTVDSQINFFDSHDTNNFIVSSSQPQQQSCEISSNVLKPTITKNYAKILPKTQAPSLMIDLNTNSNQSNLSTTSSSLSSSIAYNDILNGTIISTNDNQMIMIPKPSPSPSQQYQQRPTTTTSKRKEKTMDELINKIKQTEAALPPRAKPGRKSKQATEEDSKEKKRLSLERNRAAAMRCRLKKKKEIDELKNRVEKYEHQNRQLNNIIDSLYKEVTRLKNELLLHKDCN